MPCSNPGKPLERTAFDPGPMSIRGLGSTVGGGGGGNCGVLR